MGDVWLVTKKDLKVEWRSRSAVGHLVPFAILVLVLFGFALNANRPTLDLATPGLFWMSSLFVAVIAVQRSVNIESSDSAQRMMLLSGMSVAAIFLGKAAAVLVNLLVTQLVLVVGVLVLFEATVESWGLLVAATGVAAVGLAAAGSLLGVVVAGTRSSVLPLLLLPVCAPVLIGATRAFDDALGTAALNGWAWVGLLGVFALVNLGLGAFTYGALLEDI